MPILQYDNVVEALMEAVPELRPCYEAERRQWGDELPGPHVIFGDVLNPYLLDLLGSDRHIAKLCQVFQFLERLGDDPKLLHKARQYMGARMRLFSDEVEAFWGRKG